MFLINVFFFRKARVEQGFQKLVEADDVFDKSVEDLKQCLDNWSTKTTKTKRKKKKEKETIDDAEIKKDDFTAEIEKLGNY